MYLTRILNLETVAQYHTGAAAVKPTPIQSGKVETLHDIVLKHHIVSLIPTSIIYNRHKLEKIIIACQVKTIYMSIITRNGNKKSTQDESIYAHIPWILYFLIIIIFHIESWHYVSNNDHVHRIQFSNVYLFKSGMLHTMHNVSSIMLVMSQGYNCHICDSCFYSKFISI